MNLSTEKSKYVFLSIIVAVFSLISMFDKEYITIFERIGVAIGINFGSHLTYFFLSRVPRRQLKSLINRHKIYNTWKAMLKLFSGFIIVAGIIVILTPIIFIIDSLDFGLIEICITCSIGLSLFLGGINLNRYLKKI